METANGLLQRNMTRIARLTHALPGVRALCVLGLFVVAFLCALALLVR